jgi:hypothetical protein
MRPSYYHLISLFIFFSIVCRDVAGRIQLMTQTPIRTEEAQQPTTTIFLPELLDPPTPIRSFTELLETYTSSCQPAFTARTDPHPTVDNDRAPVDNLTPLIDLVSASNHTNRAAATAQPVAWLWQQRLPLGGITLLDGDHGLGKSLLSLQIAAAVSSGKPMPDGTPTIQGGVIIVTPFTDPNTTQRQHLIDLGADLDRIEILSFVPNTNPHLPQNPHFPPSKTRVFSIPEDFAHLFAAIERVNARLIIFDPFIHLLSRHHRYTKQRLSDLLTDLNHFLIDHRIACLILRNCRAKGGHAKPTPLEKSDHFPTAAVSHLLLAPDPMQPKQILLSHALNQHGALTPTLALRIQPLPTNPNLAYMTIQGHHILQADQLLAHRPDTLHRHLLAQRILPIIANSTEPTSATTLYAHFPHSSISQIQRALKDLLNLGHIERPTRGFYTTCPKLTESAATTLPLSKIDSSPATIPPLSNFIVSAATTSPSSKLDTPAATTSPSSKLDTPAATPSQAKLNTPAAIKTKLNTPAATTSPAKPNQSAAITSLPKTDAPAATTSNSKPPRPRKHPHKQKKSHGRPR